MTLKKLGLLAIPTAAALLVGFAANPTRITMREHVDVAPGLQTLIVRPDFGHAIGDAAFSFSGNGHDLRIRRVKSNCRGLDAQFLDATPHDATAFFADNPFDSDANYFEIEIENLSDRPASLQLRLSFERTGGSPCGL